jgi:hypothetical protein
MQIFVRAPLEQVPYPWMAPFDLEKGQVVPELDAMILPANF